MKREQLHEAASAMGSRTEVEHAVAGESRREILLMMPSMAILFLHMGFGFSPNQDN